MSSIMRARNGLTGRSEVSEVIGLSPELKVAGPSMLGIGCPDRHALPRVNLVEICRARRVLPSRASGFVHRIIAVNQTSVFLGTKLAAEQMMKTGGGSI